MLTDLIQEPIDNSKKLITRLVSLGITEKQRDKVFFQLDSKGLRNFFGLKPSRILSSIFDFKDSEDGFFFWWKKKMELEEIEVNLKETKKPSKHFKDYLEGKTPDPIGYTGITRKERR